MLTFRNTAVVFLMIVLGLMAYDYFYEFSPWIYLIPVIGVILIVSWGCYFIQSDFFVKALCGGPETKSEIAITFDDGPHENTPAILDVLKNNNVTAAFFFIGRKIPGMQDVVKRAAGEGHIIGNHSWSHSNLIDVWPYKKLEQDIARADEMIFSATGKKNTLFRPPYGVTTPNIARLAERRKYHVIGWTVRSYDTTIRNREKLLRRIFSRMKNGSVILLHDTTPGIEIVLEKVLERSRDMNLEVVSIERLFGIKADDQNLKT